MSASTVERPRIASVRVAVGIDIVHAVTTPLLSSLPAKLVERIPLGVIALAPSPADEKSKTPAM